MAVNLLKQVPDLGDGERFTTVILKISSKKSLFLMQERIICYRYRLVILKD